MRVRTLHDLALRGAGREAITVSINQRIADAVELGPDDDLVDIGCGDGTLLRLAADRHVQSAVGFLATDEEVALVAATGLKVKQALTDRLPMANGSASVVVSNSVLLVVPREKILESLREMCRIAKTGARIYVGEIPFVAGPPPEPQFNRDWQTFAYLYRQYGLRTCVGMATRMAYKKVTGRPMIIHDGRQISFYASAEEFLTIALAAGLHPIRHWQHDCPNTRNNFLFTKLSA